MERCASDKIRRPFTRSILLDRCTFNSFRKLVIAKFPKIFNKKIERASFLEVKGEVIRTV